MLIFFFSTSSSCLAAVTKGLSSTISACEFHTASFSSVLCNTRICVTVCQHSHYGQEYTREWVGRTSEPSWHWLQHSVRNNFHFAFWYCSECRYIRDSGNVRTTRCMCSVWCWHSFTSCLPSISAQASMNSITCDSKWYAQHPWFFSQVRAALTCRHLSTTWTAMLFVKESWHSGALSQRPGGSYSLTLLSSKKYFI